MADFLSEYGLFLAKSVTVVIAILFVVIGIAAVAMRSRREAQHGNIEVVHLNEEFQEMKASLEHAVLDKAEFKALQKAERKKEKAEAKQAKALAKKRTDEAEEDADERRKRIYVLDFDGDVKASEVENLREEISTVLMLAEPQDEVVLRLESPGGMVHEYGLAASQLERIRRKNIPLTICVDRVAASGGYMMACLANRILSAPFAIVGSIGVIAQLPNFHRLLRKNDIDFEVLTAGEYKRTLTVFGENTDKGRAKFIEELEETHELFKTFVSQHRPQVAIEQVATGEIWFGSQALDKQLVDELMTSDEYLMQCADDADIYIVHYEQKKTLQDRLAEFSAQAVDRVFWRAISKLGETRNWFR
ncbi:protease SohB [Neptuniibacter sp. CAU 1671]|uniref:protease SohB n=1 Tax=Neptuniibacter sp. CAU 1671 TaxID=3032593 RepID=UPI0023DA7D7C|nr:protease SohB [Neptuniibacter sp. CAU 1671]MDF2180836.1 protease SohB [Neptuniibacter sp. CAU 1671]